MEKFTIGLIMGMAVGAVCVSNNYKMRTLVQKGQREVQDKIDDMLDEKLQTLDDEMPASDNQKSKKARAKKQTA